jgi:hypothetical protein
MHEKGVTKLGSALLARRPGSLVDVRMLKTARVCRQAASAAGRLAPRRAAATTVPQSGLCQARTPISVTRIIEGTCRRRHEHGVLQHDQRRRRPHEDRQRRAGAAGRKYAFRRHQPSANRPDDRHRARWPDFANGITIADPIARGRVHADRPLARHAHRR